MQLVVWVVNRVVKFNPLASLKLFAAFAMSTADGSYDQPLWWSRYWGRAVSPLCVCLCVWTITFEPNDLWPVYLAWWFTLTLCKVKVTDRGSYSQQESVPFWLLIHIFMWRVCLVVCQVLCSKMVNVTSCEGFLILFGSRPSDHYFRSVCWFVCLFVQSFSQPSLIRFWSNLDICYMSGSSCVP